MRLDKAQHTATAGITHVVGPLSRLLFALLTAAASLTTPAAVLAQQPARTGAQATKAAMSPAGAGESVRPFRVQVPQKAIDDLRRRLALRRTQGRAPAQALR